MKTTTLILLFSLSLWSLYGQVRSDYDKNADFTKYKKYTFMGWEKDSDQQLNDFDKERITDAFKHELKIRNLTVSNDNPDVGITLFIVIEEKTSRILGVLQGVLRPLDPE